LLRSDRGIRYTAECQNISYIHTYACVQKGRTKSVACRYFTIEVKVMGRKIRKYVQISP